MIIDAHVHIGKFNSWPLAKGQAEEKLKALRDEGIDYALASSALAISYDCPAGNAEVLAAAARYSEIVPLLCVNPRRPQQTFAELSTYQARGFVGLKLHPSRHEYALTSNQAEAVLDFCEENEIPVLTHADESDSRCGPTAIDRVATRHPALVLVVGHACLFSSREVVAVAENHPHVYLELSVNYEAAKLEDTIDRLGCERLLLGSDAPLHHPSVMVQRVKVVGLSDEEEDMILCQNARRLYRLALCGYSPDASP